MRAKQTIVARDKNPGLPDTPPLPQIFRGNRIAVYGNRVGLGSAPPLPPSDSRPARFIRCFWAEYPAACSDKEKKNPLADSPLLAAG